MSPDTKNVSWDSDTQDVEVAVIGGGSMGSVRLLLLSPSHLVLLPVKRTTDRSSP